MDASEPGRPESIVDRLEANAEVFGGLVRGVSPAQAVWRPAPDRWSILEVVCHLADEEVEDFRTRVDYALHRPGETWPPIDPEGWARTRGYLDRDPADVLRRFQAEREASVTWLRSLVRPDWSKTYTHPKIGSLSAGDLLACWAAHDALHLRQIAKRLHDLATRDVFSGDVGYAGAWRA